MKPLTIQGAFSSALVLTHTLNPNDYKQIMDLCNQEIAADSNIVIMPDVHAGKDCVIGTSMLVKDKVVPALVGADIGCGVIVTKFSKQEYDFEKLDNFIRQIVNQTVSDNKIKSKKYRAVSQKYEKELPQKLYSKFEDKYIGQFADSLGTLGGGNHFIEIDQDDDWHYLLIHSGSRFLGNMICGYWQEKAKISCKKEHFAYLENDDLKKYLSDVQIAQKYAADNRKIIRDEILCFLGVSKFESFESVHNYIDFDHEIPILRKGAVSANAGQQLIIPINMKDGALICTGKGNKKYNYTAPHGAGRLFSRSEAKELIDDEDYIKSMEGIFTKSLSKKNKDESCFAYKKMEDILPYIQDLVDITSVIKPLYNYKN